MSFQKSAATIIPIRPATSKGLGDVRLLKAMISTMRPAFSDTEENFVNTYIDPLEPYSDDYGNRIIQIGANPITLWSCHTDTVHAKPGTQKVYLTQSNFLALSKHEKSASCLGADCTVGVWLMIHMIKANIPGLYIFHRAEEVGGLGSEFIAKSTPELLQNIKYAIAFDRKGISSIITHQMGERSASEAFSASLAAQLPRGFKSDDGGSFTDTANYTSIIPECSNLSVGYENAHSSKEYLDVLHAQELLASLLKFDETQLVAERDPSVRERYFDNDWWMPGAEDTGGRSARSLNEFVKLYPDEVVDILEQYGYTVDDLYDACPHLL